MDGEQSVGDSVTSPESRPPFASSPARAEEDLPPFQDESEADAVLGNIGEGGDEEGEELFGDNMERCGKCAKQPDCLINFFLTTSTEINNFIFLHYCSR